MPENGLTPAQKSLIGSIGGHTSWANTIDRTARTAPARQALAEKFELQVDPDGVLPPDVRAKAAENARKAFYKQLAFKSAQVRAARKRGGEDAA